MRIDWLMTDCDGVLTDGSMYYGPTGEEWRRFSTYDGAGVAACKLAGIKTAILTGEVCPAVEYRSIKLGVDWYGAGLDAHGKVTAARELCPDLSCVAYVGDDVNDIPLLRACGLSACPANAIPEVRAAVTHVLDTTGGSGVLREFAYLVLRNS